MSSLEERSDAVWAEISVTNSDGNKRFLDMVLENLKEASKRYTQAYYFLLVLTAVYWLLGSSKPADFKLFDITVGDVESVRWVIPALMSFTYYQAVCAFVLEIILLRLFNSYAQKQLKEIYDKGLIRFAYPLSYFNHERILAEVSNTGGTVAKFVGFIIGLILLVVPLILIAALLGSNAMSLSNATGVPIIELFITIGFIKPACALITVVLLVRTSLLIFAHTADSVSAALASRRNKIKAKG
jgi:hypothetical protein